MTELQSNLMDTESMPTATVDQYYQAEIATPMRLEYVDGEIFTTPWQSFDHNAIVQNILVAMFDCFERSQFRIVTSITRIKIAAETAYLHPDLALIALPLVVEDRQYNLATVANPCIVIEVLSDSTESRDRGVKYDLYRKLESLKEYVLISSDSILVECFSRQPRGEWTCRSYRNRDSVVKTEGINWRLSMMDIYKHTPMSIT